MCAASLPANGYRRAIGPQFIIAQLMPGTQVTGAPLAKETLPALKPLFMGLVAFLDDANNACSPIYLRPR